MADKRCENGHFIDDSWDICPYCPQEKGEADISVIRPGRFEAGARPAAPDFNRPPGPERERRPVAVDSSSAASGPSAVRALDDPMPVDRTVAVQKADAAQQQGKRYVVGWLIGLNGSSRGESHSVRMGRNVLGRDRRSDIVINDDQASSHHADLVFRPEERRFILMDHNSTNGTYVNEGEIEPRRDLTADDVIRIGALRFLFRPLCHDGLFWDDEGFLK